MDQTLPPPPVTATTATTTTHTSSVESSPRCRNIDSWVEDSSLYPNNSSTATSGGLSKLRLMCSSGGHIVPRPHDKSLCYVGGDTRIVVVDRHVTLTDLTNRLTKILLRSTNNNNNSSTTTSFTLKYQLPSEDLDSLISVTTDEDLENMIDEYDRLTVNSTNSSSDRNKSNRIRLFLFPNKPESVSSIGSILESNSKSEDWFLNALNGASSAFSDSSSVNCLLGLEDDVSVQEKKDVSNKTVIGKVLRSNNSVQDVQSVPDSPMLETSSSFGSASSLPVTVTVDDQVKVVGGIEEQFLQMSIQQQVKHHEDVSFVAEPVPVVIAGVNVGSAVAIGENANVNRVLSEDERLDQSFQTAHCMQVQQQQQQYHPKASIDSVSSDGSIANSLSSQKPPVIYQDPAAYTQFATNNIIDQNTRIQIQQKQIQDSAHLPSTPTTRVDPQNHQLHHQPQFIHTAVPPPQYLHHQSGAVPMGSFYPIYPPQTQYHAQHPALDQHNMVYYMPATQPPQGYHLPLQADASLAASNPPNNLVPPSRAVQSTTKTEPSAGAYRTTTNPGASAPQLVQPQFVGYSHIHQPSKPVTSGGNYYEFADPSQQGHHMYYAAQPLPPQSAAQYQAMTSTLPVEAQAGSHLQAGNSMNQQVRTSQP